MSEAAAEIKALACMDVGAWEDIMAREHDTVESPAG